jgi:hypothetical protein
MLELLPLVDSMEVLVATMELLGEPKSRTQRRVYEELIENLEDEIAVARRRTCGSARTRVEEVADWVESVKGHLDS